MINFTILEKHYFKLLENEISIKEFEHWLYDSEWLEKELGEDIYLDWISIDYNSKAAKHEIRILLTSNIGIERFETLKMIRLLNVLIERKGREIDALIELYDLYCGGYHFLQELGINYGLGLIEPYKVEVEKPSKLIDSYYPKVKDLAISIKDLLENGTIKLLGSRIDDYYWEYIDYRK